MGAALTASANLVQNYSFETGDFTSWTLGAGANNTFVGTGFATDGSYAAYLGHVGSVISLSQTLSTVAGQYYRFEFDLESNGTAPNSFAASFGSNTVFSAAPLGNTGLVHYSYLVQATSSSTLLNFDHRKDPSFFHLDNVQVNAVSGVPGPAAARRRARRGAPVWRAPLWRAPLCASGQAAPPRSVPGCNPLWHKKQVPGDHAPLPPSAM